MSNKLLIHKFFEEVVNKADLGLADQIIAVDLVMHNPRPGQGKGLLGFKEGLSALRQAFPNWCSNIEELIEEGDLIAARWSVRGTHHGSFLGLQSTGVTISMKEIGMFRIVNGKISEIWAIADELSLFRQLGIHT
jgi:predicted ester cyclase